MFSIENIRFGGVGSSTNQGRVEVYINNRWALIDDDDLGENEANIICRQMGFRSGRAYKKSRYPDVLLVQFVLKNLKCNGDEQQIAYCKTSPLIRIDDYNFRNTDNEDVYILCSK